MKFNENGYSDRPVLRPNATDYPDGRFTTKFRHRKEGDGLLVTVEFDIEEPAIARLIDKGDAVYCAQVYCAGTCYTEMLVATPGSQMVSATIPLSNLNGRVEVHPSVISIDDVALPTGTAHPEYEDKLLSLPKYSQLAADTPWHFTAEVSGNLESIFTFERDDEKELEDGELWFDIEPKDTYITIRSNSVTSDVLPGFRSHEKWALASIYLVALTDALSILSALGDQPDEYEPPVGWAATLRKLLTENRLSIFDGRHPVGYAAQKLLRNPLTHLLEEFSEGTENHQS